MQENPHGCCGGGDGTEEDPCCPGNPLPLELTATFLDGVNCTALHNQDATLTWDDGEQAWLGSIGLCGDTFDMKLVCTSMFLTTSQCSYHLGGGTVEDFGITGTICDRNIIFEWRPGTMCPCCTSVFNVFHIAVTE